MRAFRYGIQEFNLRGAKKGIRRMIEKGAIAPTPAAVARLFHEYADVLDKAQVGDYLGGYAKPGSQVGSRFPYALSVLDAPSIYMGDPSGLHQRSFPYPSCCDHRCSVHACCANLFVMLCRWRGSRAWCTCVCCVWCCQ
eukprot:COSAG05_NODE_1081_length_5940_cov_4.264852_4_plen_139_part_00